MILFRPRGDATLMCLHRERRNQRFGGGASYVLGNDTPLFGMFPCFLIGKMMENDGLHLL